MPLSFTSEVKLALLRFLDEIIPEPQDRITLTWANAGSANAYMLPLFFMGYLARRKDTRLVRLLLLPTVVFMTLRGTYSYIYQGPNYMFFNWMRGIVGVTMIARCTDLAFSNEAWMKIGETELAPIHEDKSTNGKEQGPRPSWFQDALEVSFVQRGVGWNHGRHVYIPPETRPLEKQDFLRTVARTFLKTFLLVDLCDSLIKSLPDISHTEGGSMFYTSLPPLQRYLVSTGVQVICGVEMLSGFEMGYSLATLIGVGLLGQPPQSWKPLQQNPWAARSLREFWAKRWHQGMRRTFLVLGGIPGGWIAGRTGMVVGTFLASGLVHEWGACVIGPMDYMVLFFFLLQALGVLLESVWEGITGRKVGGVLGRMWAYIFILGIGQICMDSWFRRGIGASILVPGGISPTRRILFPAIRQFLVPLVSRFPGEL